MADMKIAMTLTMADLASPEIQKFKANLLGMQDAIKGLADTFKMATDSSASFGKSLLGLSGGAMASVGRLNGMLQGLGDRLSAVSQAATMSTAALQRMGEASATAETSALQPIVETLRAVSAQMGAVAIMGKRLATETDYVGDSFKVAGVSMRGAADAGGSLAQTLAAVDAETANLFQSSMVMNKEALKSAFTFQKAEAAATEYDASVTRIGATLQAVAAQTQEMIAATMTMDKTMLNAAFAATGLGDKSLGAGAKIAAMGDDAAAADTKMAGMHGTMKGLLELYASFKIGEGLKKSVEQASTYQQTMMMLKMRNLPASQVGALASGAQSLSNAIPLLNRNQALEAELAAQPGLPGQSAFSKNMRAQLLPGVTRLGLVAGTFGDAASMTHRVQNIFGIIEALGGAENVARAKMILQDVRGAIVASHGKLDVRSIETALRTTNPGIRTNMNSVEFRRELALQEEMKAARGGGSGGNTRIATLMNNIFMAANKGLMAKGAVAVMETLRLLNPADVHKYGKSSYYAAINPGALAGSSMASQSPSSWVQQYLLPALTKFGEMHWKRFGYSSNSAAAFSDPTQIGRANAEAAAYLASFRMGGQQFAGGLGLLGNPNVMAAVNSQIHAQNRATGISSQQDLQLRLNTAAGAAQKLDAQLVNLGIQVGTALLPALTQLANGISFITSAISNLNSHFPIFAKIEAWAAALVALMLGIKGVEWLMGIRQGFLALKAVDLGKVMLAWAADAVMATDAGAGLVAGLGGLGAVIAGLAAPITLAVVAIGGLGYAAYRLYNDLTSSHSLGMKPGYTHWTNNGHIGLGIKTGTTWTTGTAYGPAETAGEAAYAGAHGVPVLPGSIISRMGATPSAGSLVKHATAVAHAHQKAIDHLYAIADKAAAKANAVAAKMNAAALKLHLAFMAMTNPLGAKIAGVQLKYGGMAAQMTVSGHPGAASDALSIGQSKIMGIKYQAGMQHLGMLKANLHDTITGNAALVQTGAMTKMQAAQANISAQKQAAPAMVHILQTLIAMEKASAGYAHNLASQKIVANLKAQEATLKAMGSQLGYYSAKVKNVAQNAMTGLFQNMMHGQKTWGQMFGSFFASIGKSLENILAKSISSAIANALFTKKAAHGISSVFSFLTGGSAKGSGSLIGAAGSLLGNLFGSSSRGSASAFSGAGILGSGAFSAGGGGIMSSIGGWLKGITSIASIFGFASGANSIPNDMVANIHKGEMIIPAAGASLIRSGQASIGGMPAGNHVHLTIHAMDSQSVISALHSVRHEAAQMFINTASSMNLQGG